MVEMKDSGNKWFGLIPAEWDSIAIRYLVQKRDGGAWGNEPQDNETDRICIRVADFDYNQFSVSDDKEKTVRNYKHGEIARLTLHPGDILIEKSGGGEKTPVGRTVIFDEEYEALYANFIERIRLIPSVNVKFIQYCFVAFYKAGGTIQYFNQTTGIQNLNISKMFREIRFPIPRLSIQNSIAEYLDKKCSEINSLSEEIQQQIDVLENYRQSVICEAVTHGIDPRVSLKDSGTPWCPQIPEHWMVTNPKALFSLRNQRAIPGERQLTASQKFGIVYQDEFMEMENQRVVTVEKDFSILKHVEPNDFVISMRSFQGGLEYSELTGCISSAYVMLIPNNEKVYPPFYRWFFKSSKYINAIQSTTNLVRDGQAMRYANFVQVPLFIIPVDEQKRIADYLYEKIAKVDAILDAKTKQLEVLENYKKALIYEYITGKKTIEEARS